MKWSSGSVQKQPDGLSGIVTVGLMFGGRWNAFQSGILPMVAGGIQDGECVQELTNFSKIRHF